VEQNKLNAITGDEFVTVQARFECPTPGFYEEFT
jgi:hypothetical protein